MLLFISITVAKLLRKKHRQKKITFLTWSDANIKANLWCLSKPEAYLSKKSESFRRDNYISLDFISLLTKKLEK